MPGGMVIASTDADAAMIELNRILCPIDFSPFSDRAIGYATSLAKRYGANLSVVHVRPPMPPSTTSELATAARRLSERNMRNATAPCAAAGIDAGTDILESAEAAPRILEYAEQFDADLIVAGSHGRTGVRRVLLGSVVEALLHRSARPLLIIPSHADAPDVVSFNRIVCGVDFSNASVHALAYALSMAEEADAQLTVLHVIEVPPELQQPPTSPDYDVDAIRAAAEAACRDRLRTLIPDNARDYCTIDVVVREGGAGRQILRLADEQRADLIVLGVHGRNAFDLAFFGSNSKDIVRQAHCPVLVIPASHHARAKVVAANAATAAL